MTRRVYLDWLRGVAVLVMVEAHLFDSWVGEPDRLEPPYRWAIVIGGFSAPMFLFLAGVALALAASSRLRNGAPASEVAALARKRGWQIVGLAFLFRLQSFLISGGAFPQTLLRVDILNVMGLSMLMAALLWGAAGRDSTRVVLLASVAQAFAMATPIVRPAEFWASMPYPIAWYGRSVPGSGAFSLFPWPAFLLAGSALGVWLNGARTPSAERRAMVMLGVIGPLMACGGYAASFLPPLFPATTFWTGSPTFFFVRLGVVMTTVPIAYAWTSRWHGWSPLREVGVSSLFVYWIHVEMVYGVASLWIHKSLSFEQAVAAYVAFVLLLYGLVKLKNRLGTLAPFAPSAPSHPRTVAPSNPN